MRIASSVFYSAAGSHLETVLGVVTSTIIARSLGASDFGSYSLLLMWITVSQTLVNSGLSLAAQRFVSQARTRDTEEIAGAIAHRLRTIQRYKLICALVVVAAVLPFYGKTSALNIGALTLALVLISIVARSSYVFQNAVCKGAGNFKIVAIVTWIGSISNVLLVGLAGIFQGSLTAFLITYAISSTIFMLASAHASRRYILRSPVSHIPEKVRSDMSKHLTIVTMSTMLASLASSQIEIFFLGMYANSHDAGFFRLGHMLGGGAIGIISGVIASITLPHVSKALAEGPDAAVRTYEKLTRYLVLLSIPVVAFVSAISSELVPTVYGAEYRPAAQVLCAMLIAFAIEDISAPAQAYLIGTGKLKAVLVFTVLALVLKLSFGSYLISQFGLFGALASYLSTVVIIAAARMLVVRNSLGLKAPLVITVRAVLLSAMVMLPAYGVLRLVPGMLGMFLAGLTFSCLYIYGALRMRFLSGDELAAASRLCARLPAPLRALSTLAFASARTF